MTGSIAEDVTASYMPIITPTVPFTPPPPVAVDGSSLPLPPLCAPGATCAP